VSTGTDASGGPFRTEPAPGWQPATTSTAPSTAEDFMDEYLVLAARTGGSPQRALPRPICDNLSV